MNALPLIRAVLKGALCATVIAVIGCAGQPGPNDRADTSANSGSMAESAKSNTDGGGETRLVGPVWVAEDIGGRGVIDNLQSSITFTSKDAVTGFSGCNTFRGRYERDGATIRIGPLASTRKACPPAVMDQETRFHDALENVRGFRDDNDLLYLLDQDGDTVVRLWQRR